MSNCFELFPSSRVALLASNTASVTPLIALKMIAITAARLTTPANDEPMPSSASPALRLIDLELSSTVLRSLRTSSAAFFAPLSNFEGSRSSVTSKVSMIVLAMANASRGFGLSDHYTRSLQVAQEGHVGRERRTRFAIHAG